MLQGIMRWQTFTWLLLLATGMLLPSCKSESTTESDERDAYLADYESPMRHWGFLDQQGKLAIPPIYDEVGFFSEGKAAFNVGGLWGFIDTSGKEVIRPQFRSAYPFHDRRARVKPFNLEDCYTDLKGNLIRDDSWIAVGDFSNGLARIRSGQAFGYIDSTGHLKVKPIYTRAWDFEGSLATIELQGKLGAIATDSKEVLKPVFDQILIRPALNRLVTVRDRAIQLYDLQGKLLTEFLISPVAGKTVKVIDISQSDLAIQVDNHFAFCEVRKPDFKPNDEILQLYYLGEDRWAVKRDTSYTLCDGSGRALNEHHYDQLNKFKEGIAAFRRDQYWGYLNAEGKELTNPEFGLAWDYKEGFARAAFKDGIAFIDQHQKVAFMPPATTFDLRDFSEGLAPVQMKR